MKNLNKRPNEILKRLHKTTWQFVKKIYNEMRHLWTNKKINQNYDPHLKTKAMKVLWNEH